MTDGLIWQDPPNTHSRLDRVKDALKTRSGSWALIDTYPLLNVNSAWWSELEEDELYQVRIYKAGTFDTRHVYARYIG
jgi:hypothetical protein